MMNIPIKKKSKTLSLLFYVLFTVCALFFFRDIISESFFGKYSKEIKIALNYADSNQSELVKVLDHYRASDNKMKLKAAKLLISNCYIYFNQNIEIIDESGNPVNFNPTKCENSSTAKNVRDSLFQEFQVKREIYYDCRELSAKYLIRHIDKSFESWEKSPWFKKVSFSQFCNYILPYRVNYEPLSNWHDILHERYSKSVDTLIDKSIVNVCTVVNTEIAKDLRYDNRWIAGGFGVQSIPQMLSSGSGMCDDLAVFGVAAMRSFGIPAAIDFTTWARRDLGHSWCVIFDEQGKAWSFGPGEQNPGEHINIFSENKGRTLAKVFRKKFQIDRNSAIKGIKDLNKIPPLFRSHNIIDVTHEYVKTFEIKHEIEQIRKEHDYVYLCVWNRNQWRPIDKAKIMNDKNVLFRNVGGDNVYIVSYYNYGRIEPVTNPFILSKDGGKILLNGSGRIIDRAVQHKLIAGIGEIKPKDEFILNAWKDKRWQIVENLVAKDSSLIFEKKNASTLYQLVSTLEPNRKSRPFTIQNEACFW